VELEGFLAVYFGLTKKQLKRALAPILWIVDCSMHDFRNQQNLYMLFDSHISIFATKNFFWTLLVLSNFLKLKITL